MNPDEIEEVGIKLRRYQKAITGTADPLPSETEPSPLHLITMVKSYGGNAWWLKKILWEFGLYTHPERKFPFYKTAIVPNTPSNNLKLAMIKHMVRVDAVTFPFGYPEDEADLKYMRVSEHGEVTFVKEVASETLADDDDAVKLIPSGVPRAAPLEEMDDETLKVDCRRKLSHWQFLEEYHPATPQYKLGQNKLKGMKVYWKEHKRPIVY